MRVAYGTTGTILLRSTIWFKEAEGGDTQPMSLNAVRTRDYIR